MEKLVGTKATDVLRGTADADFIAGEGGADRLVRRRQCDDRKIRPARGRPVGAVGDGRDGRLRLRLPLALRTLRLAPSHFLQTPLEFFLLLLQLKLAC